MTFETVLDALDVMLEPFALCEIRGNSTLGLGRRAHAVLHYVLAGEGRLAIDGWPALRARAGSVILVPAFAPHSLTAEGEGRGLLPDCRPLEMSIEHVRIGEGEGVLAAICGRVQIVYRGLSGAMDLLRAPIVEHLAPDDRVRGAMEDLLRELANPKLGSRALARSLLLQCVILLFRRRLEAGDDSVTWLRGLSDEALWSALQQMLDRPQGDHTVQSLADAAGMSRALFAARFREAYGAGPIELLRSIRLRRAAELLTMSDLPVKRIAALVGYDSRTYFSRAFRAHHGTPPERFRSAG